MEGASQEAIKQAVLRAVGAPALSEGFCPRHSAPLEAVEGDSAFTPTGKPWLKCTAADHYYQISSENVREQRGSAWRGRYGPAE